MEPQANTFKQNSPLQPAPTAKTAQPSTTSVATEPQTTTPKPTSPRLTRPPPLSPSLAASRSRAAYQLPPSQSAARPKPSAPSLPSQASPRVQALTKPQYPPKREPVPIQEHPLSPTLVNQSSSSKKKPEELETQPKAIILSKNALDSGTKPQSRMISDEVAAQPVPASIQRSGSIATSHDHKSIPDSESKLKESKEVKRVSDEPIREQNEGPEEKDVTELPVSDTGPKSETVVQPGRLSRGHSKEEISLKKEIVSRSEAARKLAETSIPSYPKVGKPHNHKSAGEKAPLQKEITEDISKFVHKLAMGQGQQPLDGDKQLTVITLAGENRGASMTLSNETGKKESSIHIHRGYRTNPDENVESSTDGEESSKGKNKLKDSKTDKELATKAYINSNVQGVNNSLVFSGSVSTRNPGVQYVLSHSLAKATEGKQYETLKAEFNTTPSEKHAYAPTVRRRCLRGLFLESSDSDPENPEKPRRHGCRYGCKDKNKDGKPDVL